MDYSPPPVLRGRVREGVRASCVVRHNPHPSPLPEYRGREKRVRPLRSSTKSSQEIIASANHVAAQSIPHDPGAPPQRPQVGAADALADSAPTAKTLSVRAVFSD